MRKPKRQLPRFRAVYGEAAEWGHVLAFMGGDLTSAEWAEKIGCHPMTIRRMCRRMGWRTQENRREEHTPTAEDLHGWQRGPIADA